MKIVNVMAATVDGHIALTDGENDASRRAYGFTSDADYRHLRQLVATCDAIIAGANTVRVSPKLIDCQNQQGRYPLWVVLTTRGITDGNPFWKTGGERWVVSPQQIPTRSSARYLVYGANDPAQFIVNHLRQHGVREVLLFGGGIVNRLFYRRKLVNELILTVCPLIVARNDAPKLVAPQLRDLRRLQLLESRCVDSHVFLHYRVVG